MRRIRLLLLGALFIGVAAACRPAPPPPTTILYGDSLSQQSTSYISAILHSGRPGWRSLFRNYGGTALCDWLDEMRNDGDENARVVVIQFSGNSFTPCMTRYGSSGTCTLTTQQNCIAPETNEWRERYRNDARTAVRIWKARGVRILFVGSPRGVCYPTPHPLDAEYNQAIAAEGAGAFSAAPELALTVTLPGKFEPPTTQPPTTQPPTTQPPTTQPPTTQPPTTEDTSLPPDTGDTGGGSSQDPGPSQQAATSEDADPPDYGPGEAPEPVVQAATTWPCQQPDYDTRVFAFEMECTSYEMQHFAGRVRQPACVQVDDSGTPSPLGEHWVIQVRDGTRFTPGGHFCNDDNPNPALRVPTCYGYVAGIRRFGGAIATAAANLMY